MFNESIIDSCEGVELVSIHKTGTYNSPVVAYHIRHNGAVMIYQSLSAAERAFDDICDSPFYQGLERTLSRAA